MQNVSIADIPSWVYSGKVLAKTLNEGKERIYAAFKPTNSNQVKAWLRNMDTDHVIFEGENGEGAKTIIRIKKEN